MTNPTNQHVTRTEFEAGMRRIEGLFDAGQRRLEALLEKQTEILQSLAVTSVENRIRDQQLADLKVKADKLEAELDKQKQKLAWYAGALATVGVVSQFVLKKLGLG